MRDRIWTQEDAREKTSVPEALTVDAVPKKTTVVLALDSAWMGESRTCFKNANLGFPAYIRVESACSILIYLWKQVRKKEFEEKIKKTK